MTFLGILLALALERALGRYGGWGRPVLFLGYLRAFQKMLPIGKLWTSWAAPLILLAPLLLLLYYVRGLIASPFLDILLSAGILLLCLGPRDLAEDVHNLLDARARGDTQAANQLSRALLRGPHADASRRTLIGALFIQSHERLFGVLLWFFAAGPVGALLYRLVSRLPRALNEMSPDSNAARVAETLHDLLAWLPGRATALLYGLAGSLDDALGAWRALAFNAGREWRAGTWAVLAAVPAASLSMEEADGSTVVPATLDASLDEVLKMQARALLIMLAFFAIFTTGALVQ
jgi:membrane protein required for beta-lactamase induction